MSVHTERFEHRIEILFHAPVFRLLPAKDRDALSERLVDASDLADLDDQDRALIREATLQVGDGAASSTLPGAEGNWTLIDEAMDSGDDWLIERALDTVARAGQALSHADMERIAEEAEQYARELRRGPVDARETPKLQPGDGVVCTDASLITHNGTPDGGGAGPFTLLRVLRVHADGTLDLFRDHDVPPHPDQRRQQGSEPDIELFRVRARPLRAWIRVDPERVQLLRMDVEPLWPGELERLNGASNATGGELAD